MSTLYDDNPRYTEDESRKNHNTIDPYPQNRVSGLTRYRSAPSSFFDNGDFGINDDYRFFRSTSSEMENLFGKCLEEEDEEEERSVKKEENDNNDMSSSVSEQIGFENNSESVYRNVGVQNFGNGVSFMDNRAFGVMDNLGVNDSVQVKSNLARQNSSPAVFLSDLGIGNGLEGHMNISYAKNSSHMPQIAEDRPESNSIFSDNSWTKSSFNVLKREGEHEITFSTLDSQKGDSKNRLAHHLSLPTTFSGRVTTEKFLHFQSTVPCKIRAKRGFATHPRSIAERVRRTRISERMRKLQDLFPTMDKQTNTADMLDMAVAQIKELQKQVKVLTGTRASCTCAGIA